MKDHDGFIREVGRLAPDLTRAERLWEALRAGDPAPEADAARSERGRAILASLLTSPQDRTPLWEALRWEIRLLAGSSMAVTGALTVILVLFVTAGPQNWLHGQALAWVALGSPWLGMLWGLTVTPARRGAWADWQAMAPLSWEVRLISRLALLGLVSLAMASIIASAGIRGIGAGVVILSWIGPFGLGSVAMVALTWRFGVSTALLVSAGGWALLMMGEVGSTAHSTAANEALGMPGPVLASVEGTMLAVALGLALWLARRGSSWTSD